MFRDLFRHMSLQGACQQVYVPEKRADDMGKFPSDHYKLTYSLIIKPQDRFLYYTKAKRCVPDINARVDLSGVTLVHAHTLFTDGGIAYKLGLPYIVSLRFTDIEYFYKYMPHLRPHATRILRKARAVVFLSSASRDKVLGEYVPQKYREEILAKCVVIPNGIDDAWLDGSPRTLTDGALTVGFCGKLEPRKAPIAALQAAKAAQTRTGRSTIFLVAGDGPLREQLLSHPDAKGLLDYRGKLSGVEAMKAFYGQCDVLLVPSLAETFGLVYLEAMSQGTCVLYTKGQGFDGQFPDGEVGFAVKPGDVQGMAQAISDCLDGYDGRSRRCIDGANAMRWDGIAARMLALYKKTQ